MVEFPLELGFAVPLAVLRVYTFQAMAVIFLGFPWTNSHPSTHLTERTHGPDNLPAPDARFPFRWAKVISRVPCGGSEEFPAGQLLIVATIEEIDGPGEIVGFAGSTNTWSSCPVTT